MKNLKGLILPKSLGLILLFLLGGGVARAENTRTQIISLRKGWNAVQLQVDLVNPKPADCFSGTPVSMVASYVGDGSAVQYVQNPATNNVNKENGWTVWYAPERPDSFLTRLFSLNANQTYLIYSKSDYVWSATGAVVLSEVKWKPNSFNLAGFCLDEVAPPSFAQFFDASSAHRPYRIYRLIEGQWTLVDQVQTAPMRSGEAYWIFCHGSSDYQGPLSVRIQNGQKILLNGISQAGVLLANKTSNPLSVRVESSPGSAVLPLAYILRVITETNLVSAAYNLPPSYNMPVFEPGESRGFWLTLRPEQMSASTGTTLLKITTDLGTQCWLPVVGNRSELNPSN